MSATHPEIPAEDDFVTEILARRKRRTPKLTLTLAVLVVAAAAFIGGIEAQKHWGHSSAAGGGGGGNRATSLAALASRFGITGAAGASASRRFGGTGGGATGFGGASGSGATGFGGGSRATGFGGGGAAGFGGFGGGSATVGTVTLIKGSTLYVTDASGNTVKVKTSPSSTVTKTVQGSIKTVLPGQTVTVLGTAGKDGTVTARSISVSAARR
ncbi:MAG TPA: hypothetical protein VHC45_09475 [Gaiellaceae bacterium]|jgi:hypothetical protein|nr:hypothetical protein [Gaiellaceae bacterium]